MYIIGASGHAKAVIDLVSDKRLITGVYDDNPEIGSILNIPVISPFDYAKTYDQPLFVAIGDNSVRKGIVERSGKGNKYITLKHASALVSETVKLGFGTVLMEGAIVKVDSEIGNHVIVNTGASIDHDCIIGDFAHIAPQSTLCGNVSIGEGTLIGAGSVLLPGVSIGSWCVIGAGSVVKADIPDYTKWKG